jgi:hypothetical protein
MKEFVEKLIGRLEEEKGNVSDYSSYEGKKLVRHWNNCVDVCKEIVNQLAEEYNNGWISCSERLPEVDGTGYLVQKTNGFIDILDFTKDAYKLDRYDFAEYKGKKKSIFFGYDSEYGYIEWECEAWMPLPAPYQKGSDV